MTTSIKNTTITSSPTDTTTDPVIKKPTRPLTAYHLFFQLERGESIVKIFEHMICLFFLTYVHRHIHIEYILQTTRSNDDIANISKDDRPLGKGKYYSIHMIMIVDHILQSQFDIRESKLYMY